MTTAACSKWKGLFSVEELDDEDLLDADWTHTPDSAVPVCLSLSGSHADCSHVAQQSSVAQSAIFSNPSSGLNSNARHDLSDVKPANRLRSLANSNSASSAFLPASSHSSNAISALQCPSNSPHVQSKPHSDICDVPIRTIPAQDDFDDWDIDLEELDKCVFQSTSAPDTTSASDIISPAKRMRSSVVSENAPVLPSLRAFCNSTPKCAPSRTFIHSSSSTTPQNSKSFIPPARHFTSPVTPGAVRATSQWSREVVAPQAERRSLFHAVSPALSTPQTPRPLNMPVLTNHLVQLVSAASKTPQRPRKASVRSVTCRFPGPAGALPQQFTEKSLDEIIVAVPQTPAHGAVARLRSQAPDSQVIDDEEFSIGPWTAMKTEMGLDERNPSCFLHSYSIVMVLRKAALRQLLKNKVPNMAVVLKSILHTHADAKAVFKDPTGEMQGTVHRRLLEDRQKELTTGAVLLLKQVGVFSPSNRNHYLNVTPNNLLRIYPPDGADQAPTRHSQPALSTSELLHCETSTPDRGPVSQMELLYEEEEEEEEEGEQRGIPAKAPLPASGADVSSTWPDTQWDTDDHDELLVELPVDTH